MAQKPSDVFDIIEREKERVESERLESAKQRALRVAQNRPLIKAFFIEQIPICAAKPRTATKFNIPYPRTLDVEQDFSLDEIRAIAHEAVSELNAASGDDATEYVYIRGIPNLTFDVRKKEKKTAAGAASCADVFVAVMGALRERIRASCGAWDNFTVLYPKAVDPDMILVEEYFDVIVRSVIQEVNQELCSQDRRIELKSRDGRDLSFAVRTLV